MIARIADRLAHLALRRHRSVFVVALVLAALAALAATRLRFDPDILSLVPQDNPVVNDFRRVLESMGTVDYHLVVVQIPPGRDAADYEPLVDALGAGYSALPEVRGVQYRLPDPVALIDQVLPRAFLLLTPAELDRVGAALTDPGIASAVAKNRRLLRTPAGSAAAGLIRYDPFGLLPIFLDRFRQAGAGLKLATSSGYYLSADRSTFLLAIRPRRPAQDIPFARRLTDAGTRIERRALADFHKETPDLPLPVIGHTGTYAISLYDAELIRQDVLANVAFSCVAVLALFLYAFRRPAALLYAGVPLAIAIVVTFGLAGLVFGKLSSSSAVFAALVAGLGVDFVTVLYGRYVDERRRGVGLPVALASMLKTTLGGVMVAAATTAATFYAYLATEFRGLSELGFLTASGILVFFVAILFLLPALLVATDRGERAEGSGAALVMRSFGSQHAVRLALARPGATVAVWTALVVVWAFLATGLTFNDSVENLRAKGNRGVVLQAEVTKKFGQSFGFMMLAVEGKDLDEALTRTDRATARLDPLIARGTISSYQAITTFLPPPSRQQQAIAVLNAGQADRFNADRIARALRHALVENGFRPDAYDHYLELFGQALHPSGPVGPDAFVGPLADLSHRFLEEDEVGLHVGRLHLPAGRQLEPEGPQIPLDLGPGGAARDDHRHQSRLADPPRHRARRRHPLDPPGARHRLSDLLGELPEHGPGGTPLRSLPRRGDRHVGPDGALPAGVQLRQRLRRALPRGRLDRLRRLHAPALPRKPRKLRRRSPRDRQSRRHGRFNRHRRLRLLRPLPLPGPALDRLRLDLRGGDFGVGFDHVAAGDFGDGEAAERVSTKLLYRYLGTPPRSCSRTLRRSVR